MTPDRILILTLADENYRDVGNLSGPNRLAYAGLHGYSFKFERSLADPSRAATWNKILYAWAYLPDYAWVFWTDADSLIMNSDIMLEDIISDTSEDLIITKDFNGINAGQFFIRRSDFSLAFLASVYRQTKFIGHVWEEQAAIMMLAEDPENARHIRYVDKRIFNSYPSDWRPDDFLLHFPGYGNQRERLLADMKDALTMAK